MGVDAKSTHINVKIRQNNIIVQDNGFGMDYQTLRKAARIGVSDKNHQKMLVLWELAYIVLIIYVIN